MQSRGIIESSHQLLIKVKAKNRKQKGLVSKYIKTKRKYCCRFRNEMSSTQHNTTQHNTTQHNTTQHNTTTQHNITQHNTTQHNTTQHNITQHNTTQHNTSGCKLAKGDEQFNIPFAWVSIQSK